MKYKISSEEDSKLHFPTGGSMFTDSNRTLFSFLKLRSSCGEGLQIKMASSRFVCEENGR
jgi:hypothetical protein